jgi:hypothetical protein
VWLRQVEQLFHRVYRDFRSILGPRMIEPVLGSIFGQGKCPQAVSGDAIVQV